jgi:hypothetical protein
MAPLIAAALGLAPVLLDALVGDKAGKVAAQVTDVVRTVAGSDDPAVIAGLPPEKKAELQQRLAEIALETRRADLADVQSARQLASQVPLIAKAQVSGFGLIMLVWAAIHGWLVIRGVQGIPIENAGMIVTVVSGVSTLAGAVMQFFYGNSTAANAANNRMDMLASQATNAPPAIVVAPQPSPAGTTADDLNTRELTRVR